jgi:PAS domain S-box-containing protein
MKRPDRHRTSRPRPIRQRTAGLVRDNEALMAEVRERRRVDRARQALSRCGQALVRADDEPQFLGEICRVIVEVAGYRLCWVGYAEHDDAKSVRPVAHAGYEEGYLETVRITWADTERGRGPVGTAIRTGAPAVFRDVARDPDFAPWRVEALRRGYASVIGLPLLSGPEVLGALAIYAAEPDAFDEDEVQLLGELADDLSYGIVALRTRAARQRAEDALRRAYDELERRVEERTAELSRANTRLTREVADRERAEVALRSSERMYRQLAEGILEAIVLADERGRIRLFNPAAQRTFGYAEPEVLGRPLALLMPPEYREAHERAFRRYVATREARSLGRTTELRGLRKGGEVFPLELSLSAIELPEGIVFLGAIHDLTERRRMQAMIVQAEKLASLGLLSAGVAHEINNPLAYVANNLAVLERDWRGLAEVLDAYERARPALAAASPEVAGRIDRIAEEIDLPYIRANLGQVLGSTRRGVGRISGIVEGLRGFARLDQAAVDRVDLRQAIAASLELIRGQLERRQITVEQREDGAPQVVCAPAQINQVVLNLLVNAMQAIEATGRGGGRIEIAVRSRDDKSVLEVADDGCGIPEGILPRIFDPFFTTKPVGQGTGLGLAISHGIVADHGGRIEVESTPGRGSRFRVILPVGGKGHDPGHAGRSSLAGEGRGSGDQPQAPGPSR